MYNSQEIAERIKATAKSKNIPLKKMLSDCQLGINLISHMAKGQAVTYLNFAKIADYLDCSVDYLLGRERSININGDMNNNSGVIGSIVNAPLIIDNGGSKRSLTKQEQDLLRIYDNADSKTQIELMNIAYKLDEENKGE